MKDDDIENIRASRYENSPLTEGEGEIEDDVFERVRLHAHYSIYRWNAMGARFYNFTPDEDGEDWSGEWAWSPIEGDHKYSLNLETGIILQKGKKDE